MQRTTTQGRSPARRQPSRINWLWPLLLIAAALLWIAQGTGILPMAIADWIARGWPVVLIVIGLHGLLGGARLRFVNVLIVAGAVLLLGGIIVTAYNRQSDQLRQDYKASFAQKIGSDANSVLLDVTTLATQLDISATDAADGRAVEAQFVGSPASVFTGSYQVSNGVGVTTLRENHPETLPALTAAGRGKLTVRLPVGLPIDTLKIRGSAGNLALDLSGVIVRTLDIQVQSGDVLLTVPAMAANFGLGGGVHTNSGNLTIHVPNGVTIQLTLDSGKPDFDAANYLLANGNHVQTSGTRDFQIALAAGASGTIALRTP